MTAEEGKDPKVQNHLWNAADDGGWVQRKPGKDGLDSITATMPVMFWIEVLEAKKQCDGHAAKAARYQNAYEMLLEGLKDSTDPVVRKAVADAQASLAPRKAKFDLYPSMPEGN